MVAVVTASLIVLAVDLRDSSLGGIGTPATFVSRGFEVCAVARRRKRLPCSCRWWLPGLAIVDRFVGRHVARSAVPQGEAADTR